MKVVVFAGAGTSADLGVPTMRPMLQQFLAHLRDLELPSGVIEAMQSIVDDASRDMEYAIDLIDRVESGQRAEGEFGRKVDHERLLPYQTIRGEAEWFVQHCCEQIKASAATQLWGPLLRTARDSSAKLAIATTNYDRAIEIAALRTQTLIEDGFEKFAGREFSEWEGNWSGQNVSLFKMHGSTDWYRGDQDRIIKLRHPMPLFGGLRVMPKNTDKAVESALVLPSREKLVTHAPFQEVAYEFRQKAKDADILIFVGSSLRDPHIRDVCRKHATSKRALVVSRTGNVNVDILPATASIVRESAARFLIATLPRFLISEKEEVIDESVARSQKDESDVLDWLVTAKNPSARTIDRCNAIEKLAETRVSLLKEDIADLMNSTNAEVSMFALGLIQMSEDKDELVRMAQERDEPDQMFTRELELLRGLA